MRTTNMPKPYTCSQHVMAPPLSLSPQQHRGAGNSTTLTLHKEVSWGDAKGTGVGLCAGYVNATPLMEGI